MPDLESIVNRICPSVEHHQNRYSRGLEDAVRPGIRWLDLGAGTRIHHGWRHRSESDIAARARVLVGCDLVGDNLRKNPYLSAAVLGNGKELPFGAESFDLVTANMVLEHLDDPAAVFREIARVLAPGGMFAFVTPNRGHPVVFLASLLLSRPARRQLAQVVEARASEDVFPTFYRVNTPAALRRELAGVSLRISRLESFSTYPFIKNIWPITVLECVWIRFSALGPMSWSRSNLYGELVKGTD